MWVSICRKERKRGINHYWRVAKINVIRGIGDYFGLDGDNTGFFSNWPPFEKRVTDERKVKDLIMWIDMRIESYDQHRREYLPKFILMPIEEVERKLLPFLKKQNQELFVQICD